MQSGTKLAQYEILSALGKGGMGEVWRARDTKLGREVAIKTLPEEFAKDADRLARFEREAKLLASLNHPNIAQIYGLERSSGVHALVMELVEGPTLADRIARGPIPVDEALPIARQIAEALEAAHEAGVIHRDVKPENVKVKADGTVKVLDFGLAKALEPDRSEADITNSPTLTAHATQMGIILGTAAYMAPEQAKGKPVDKRADIWAFGAVLYEMLTAKRAFAGEDVSDTLAYVLTKEVDWTSLPTHTPLPLRRLVRRCLERDPRQRLRDIGEARVAMVEALTSSGGVSGPYSSEDVSPVVRETVARDSMRWKLLAPMTAALVLVSVLVTLLAVRWAAPRPQLFAREFDVNLLPEQVFPVGGGHNVLISPDGQHLVYRATAGSVIQLYHRPLGQRVATPIPGTENARYPFFSPDSQSLGFSAGDTLKTAALAGGQPFTLCERCSAASSSGAWSPLGDSIVFGHEGSLWQISVQGGDATRLVGPGSAEGSGDDRFRFYDRPAFLPDGKALVFQASSNTGRSVRVVRLDDNEVRTIVDSGSDPAYSPTGHVLYAAQNSLYAVPFDARQLEVVGEPVPIRRDLRVETFGAAQYSVSDDGTLVYVRTSGINEDTALTWIDRSGGRTSLLSAEGRFFEPRISPDEQRVAFLMEDELASPEQIADSRRAYLYEVTRDIRSPLTPDASTLSLEWSPTGEWVYFSSDHGGEEDIFRIRADSSSASESVVTKEHSQRVTAVSPDGTVLLYTESHPASGSDIWAVSLEGTGSEEPLVNDRFNESQARFSADGNWIAYVSDEFGQQEVFVRPYPGPGRRFTISNNGGVMPRWSADGQDLFYVEGGRVMEVSVDASFGELSASPPRALFEASLGSGYDVATSGQRFLTIERVGEELSRIDVVLNWHRELLERVPIP